MQVPLLRIDDAKSALSFARWCVDNVGPGFHPDTNFGDYIDAEGKPLFSASEARTLDRMLDAALSYSEDAFYKVAARRQRQYLRGKAP
jgi:hypothetical protein